MARWVALLGLFSMVVGAGCIAPVPLAAPAEGGPWVVMSWSCGDVEYPMTSLLVLYGDSRLVHLGVWQGGHGEDYTYGATDLSGERALRVAEDAYATGVFDLVPYRPLRNPAGAPHFPHSEESVVGPRPMQELARQAELARFSELEERYIGTAEETNHGHACAYIVGVWTDGEWPKTILVPLESAGPAALRDFVGSLLALHEPLH